MTLCHNFLSIPILIWFGIIQIHYLLENTFGYLFTHCVCIPKRGVILSSYRRWKRTLTEAHSLCCWKFSIFFVFAHTHTLRNDIVNKCQFQCGKTCCYVCIQINVEKGKQNSRVDVLFVVVSIRFVSDDEFQFQHTLKHIYRNHVSICQFVDVPIHYAHFCLLYSKLFSSIS